MKKSVMTGIVLIAISSGCSAESDLVGIWMATSVDMSFAQGRIPPENMDEARRDILENNAPAYDLNADGTARVFGGSKKCNGRWSIQNNLITIKCPDVFLKLEKNGNKLTTLPDRTFTFERQ